MGRGSDEVTSLIRNSADPTSRAHSLAATVKKRRPDLLGDMDVAQEVAIPEAMPDTLADQEAKADHVVDIGRPISACFLTRSLSDPTHWYLVRTHKSLLTHSQVDV